MFPLVRELAAAGAPVRVSVAVACRVLGFSKQAYYQWLANPVSDRDWDEAHLINAARDVWDEDRCQGSGGCDSLVRPRCDGLIWPRVRYAGVLTV